MDMKVPQNILQTERVEMYLHDLMHRLKELRLQHEELLQNSVEIINEIDEVSLTLLLTQDISSENEGRIKRLIQKFETTRDKNCRIKHMDVKNIVDVHQVLKFFEKLNKSHVLTESLELLHKAKDSFQKVDAFFGMLGSSSDSSKQLRLKNMNSKKLCISESIRNKIDKFNEKQKDCNPTTSKNIAKEITKEVEINKQQLEIINQNNDMMDSNSHYSSCCSSLISIERLKLKDDGSKISDVSNCSTSLTGYDGDNDDSEFDFLAAQKKIIPKI